MSERVYHNPMEISRNGSYLFTIIQGTYFPSYIAMDLFPEKMILTPSTKRVEAKSFALSLFTERVMGREVGHPKK